MCGRGHQIGKNKTKKDLLYFPHRLDDDLCPVTSQRTSYFSSPFLSSFCLLLSSLFSPKSPNGLLSARGEGTEKQAF